MNLVAFVKDLCTSRGISIPKLEQELGFGRGSIYGWDKHSPSFEKVLKVAKYFGLQLTFSEETENESRAIRSVIAERARQDAKWGQQNHEPQYWMGILGEEFGELCKAVNETVFNNGPEERKKGGYENMRREAVQVAAVAIAFVEYLDRQYGG